MLKIDDTMLYVAKSVAEKHGMDVYRVFWSNGEWGMRRSPKLLLARQDICYALRYSTGLPFQPSFPEITSFLARYLGYRNSDYHSSAMMWVKGRKKKLQHATAA